MKVKEKSKTRIVAQWLDFIKKPKDGEELDPYNDLIYEKQVCKSEEEAIKIISKNDLDVKNGIDIRDCSASIIFEEKVNRYDYREDYRKYMNEINLEEICEC